MLRIGREAGYGKLTAAIKEALAPGCADVAAIRHLMMSDRLRHTVGEAVDISSLQTSSFQTVSIAQHAKALRLAAVVAQFASLAEEAAQHSHSHLH